MTVTVPAPDYCAAPHSDGLLALRFACDPHGRTYLAERRQRFPLRTTVAMHLDPRDPAMAFVYVQNPSGGVFEGDRLNIQVTAEPETRVHLTSQSATKLCRSHDGGRGTQEWHIGVGSGAYVEHIPDALIPHKGARYHQNMVVELADDASFVGSDLLSPGRIGERFAYDELVLSVRFVHDGDTLAEDVLRFEPRTRLSPANPASVGNRDWLASLLAVNPACDGEALAAMVENVLLDREPDVLVAAGALPNGCGVIARVVASDAPTARRALRSAWAAVRGALIESTLPPLRK